MSIDEEILLDEQETQREIQYIRRELPDDTSAAFADDSLLAWVLDAIAEYYFESGVLESTSDEVSIDMDDVAAYVCSLAEQEGHGKLDAQDVRLVAELDLDFQEENV